MRKPICLLTGLLSLGLLFLNRAPLMAQDSDLDGFLDLIDLDDDNDGIPDSVEFPCTRFDYQLNAAVFPADGQTLTTSTGVQVSLDFQETGAPGTIVQQIVLPGNEIFFENDFTSAAEQNQLEISFAPILSNAYLQFTDFDQSLDGAYGETWTLQMFNGNVEVPFIIVSMGANLLQNGNTFSAFQGGNTQNDPDNTLLIVLTEDITRMVITAGAVSLNGEDNPPLFGTNIFLGSCGRDTDGDGVLDHLDLDSDNDGIFDAVEAGHCQSHLNGVLPGIPDAFGIPLIVSANNGLVNYVPADTDNDGLLDAIDLDFDNDGCFDSKEAGVSDPDNDGIAGVGLSLVNTQGMVEGLVYADPINPLSLSLDTLVCEPITLAPVEFLDYACGLGNIRWTIGDAEVNLPDPGLVPFDGIFPIGVFTDSYCETFEDSGQVSVYFADAGSITTRDPILGEDTLRVCETTEAIELFASVPDGEWSINGISTGNGLIDSIFVFDPLDYTPGSYKLGYTLVTEQGCVDSTALPVRIAKNPEALFIPETYAACAPAQNMVFTNLSQGNDIIGQSWSFLNQQDTQENLTATFAQPGEYVVALEVETAEGCTDSHQETLIVYPQPEANMLFPDVARCSPMQVPFELTPSEFTQVTWSVNGELESSLDGFTHTFIDTIPTHEVILELGYENTCFDQDTAYFYPLPKIVGSFELEAYLLGDEEVILMNTSENASMFRWDFGGETFSGFTSEEEAPTISYIRPGNYRIRLEVENEGNCIDSASLDIAFFPIGELYIPNAFSPNADGHNDAIQVVSTYPPKDFEWEIFDRWGKSIARFEAIEEAWDGRLPNGEQAPEGVYSFFLRYLTEGDRIVEEKGTVTLIR